MKHRSLLPLITGLCLLASLFASAQVPLRNDSNGLRIGTASTDKIAFHGQAPVVRPSSADETALTDSTGGSVAAYSLAVGVGKTTISIPLQLASMTTAAADLVTEYTPGYKFKILAVDFITTTLGAGSGASQTLNLEIGTTNVTGGVVNPTLSSTNTLGKLTAGTSVTAANTGSATDVLSVEVAASGTVFTGGAGILLITIQNMDTADAFAREAVLENRLRAVLVTLGLMKGSS